MSDLSWLGNPELPLVQGPMAGAQDARLALAVGEAGALGALPAAMLSADALDAQLAALAPLAARGRPVHVNFFAHVPPVPDPAREAAWRARLAPYYAEAGLDPDAPSPAAARRPFGPEAAEVLERRPPAVVSFHFGLPDDDLLARVRRLGARVLATATTVDEALWLDARGVDGVVLQGLEAGGHRGHFLRVANTPRPPGQMAGLTLLRQVRPHVRRPLVLAGGIAQAADVRAARAAGADAVMAGTAFLRCPEATTSAAHRAALADPAATTALTNLFSGGLARGLVNRLMREWGPIDPQAPAFPQASAALAPLRAWAEAQGRGDFSPLWAGTGFTAARDLPAADVVRALAAGFED